MIKIFENKVILVTGGTGSIGSEIVRQLLPLKPQAIRIFSRDEHKQYLLQNELKKHKNIRYFIGDIRNSNRLKMAVKGCDYVFHAAALKHVPACEYNPFEAVETNVIGTQNLVNLAIEFGVQKLVAISTDKACHPLNVMGATKLLAEKIVSSSMYHQGKGQTLMANVRFGNVLGSRGSVVPLFINQIQEAGEVTITHKKMTRFFVSIPDAVSLVLRSLHFCHGGEVFIFKMAAMTIETLVDSILETLNDKQKKTGQPLYNPKKTIIGVRPGEKLYEILMNESEVELCLENEEMYIIRNPMEIPNWMGKTPKYPGFKKIKNHFYDSRDMPLLDLKGCKKLLVKAGLKI